MSCAQMETSGPDTHGSERTREPGKIAQILKGYLTKEQETTDTSPYGLDKALESLPTPSDEHTHLFLHSGFWVWFAYFCATGEITVTHLPRNCVQDIITEVSKTQPHASLVKRIKHTFYLSNRGTRRCKLLKTNRVELPPSLGPQVLEGHPAKRQRIESAHAQQNPKQTDPPFPEAGCPDSSSIVGTMTRDERNAVWRGRQQNSDPTPSIWTSMPTFNLNLTYEQGWPKAQNLPYVFPHSTCTMIDKQNGTASVMISFPSDPDKCRLVMDISASEVEHIAREIFNVRIKTINGRRCTVFERGAVLEIGETGTLSVADITHLDRHFGLQVGEAVRRCPARVAEFSQGAILSECVSLEIWAAVDLPARLTMKVEPVCLAAIRAALWPEQ